MLFELAIILTFQTVYGYLYQQIGLLVAIFMAGVSSGGFCMTRRLENLKSEPLLFLKTEGGIILFSLLLPLLFTIPSRHLDRPGISVLLFAVFLTTSLVSGFLIGLQFPLAARISLDPSSGEARVAQTAGWLYGVDLLGGFLGGVVGGVLLLPILGLERSCFTVALIKLSSFVVFALYRRLERG
jgi:spermidine synthase